MTDSRTICTDCANLRGDGACSKARVLRREGIACADNYHPVLDLPRWCELFSERRQRGAA